MNSSWVRRGTSPSAGAGARCITVGARSSKVGFTHPALSPRWDRRRRLETAVALLGELVLGPLITHRIPFARAAEAYELVDQRPEETAQVILTYD